jgi:hypothetical protein
MTTKNLMDRWRVPGQSYDAFMLQIIGLWEKRNSYTETAATPHSQSSKP